MPFSISKYIALLACAQRAQAELKRLWREIELAGQNPDPEEGLQNLAIQAKSRLEEQDFELVMREGFKYTREYIKRLEKERKRQRATRHQLPDTSFAARPAADLPDISILTETKQQGEPK